jgi:pyruvate/2-oxoglutarate dehydrogenase complex dihydrolipoamide acyltransferase (E2) component
MRRIAADLGLSPDTVAGTGPHGRLREADLRAAAEPVPAHAQPAGTGLVVAEADVTGARALLARTAPTIERRTGTRVGLLALLARALATAVRARRNLFAADPGADLGLRIGAASATLVDAGDLTVVALADRIDRADGASAAEQRTSPITLVASAHDGLLFSLAPLAPGQSCVLHVGGVVDRPVVVHGADGQPAIAIGAAVHLALAYDVGLIDPPGAAALLAAVTEELDPRCFEHELA